MNGTVIGPVVSSADFLAVAFDSGGVTTGPITVPFIMAMGVGLASVRGDKSAGDDSFGLVALSSVGPVLAVLVLGCFYDPGQASYSLSDVAEVATHPGRGPGVCAGGARLRSGGAHLLSAHRRGVRRVPAHQPAATVRGRSARSWWASSIPMWGWCSFLCGVNVGFSPVGAALGQALAASAWRWLLVPLGMLIGYFIVKAEPAIQVLNHQVQDVTNGSISAGAMNLCLSVGVAVSVGLAMLRVLTGVPVQWILIPGYLIALVLSRLVPPLFVGIAFDSGGVASGPMTTTFLLPLSLGACEALGGNAMTDAFGVVALVALTPLIAIQIMGLVYQYKQNRLLAGLAGEEILILEEDLDADEIIELEDEL